MFTHGFSSPVIKAKNESSDQMEEVRLKDGQSIVMESWQVLTKDTMEIIYFLNTGEVFFHYLINFFGREEQIMKVPNKQPLAASSEIFGF